jgi:hypothetical protein
MCPQVLRFRRRDCSQSTPRCPASASRLSLPTFGVQAPHSQGPMPLQYPSAADWTGVQLQDKCQSRPAMILLQYLQDISRHQGAMALQDLIQQCNKQRAPGADGPADAPGAVPALHQSPGEAPRPERNPQPQGSRTVLDSRAACLVRISGWSAGRTFGQHERAAASRRSHRCRMAATGCRCRRRTALATPMARP